MRTRGGRAASIGSRGLISLALTLSTAPLPAAVCTVPGDFASIGEAAAAAACSEVSVQAGTFNEDITVERSLSLHGAGPAATILAGRLQVRGSGVQVTLDDLRIDTVGCFGVGLTVLGGAGTQTATGRVEISNSGGGTTCPIFRDGFDIGALGRWTISVP